MALVVDEGSQRRPVRPAQFHCEGLPRRREEHKRILKTTVVKPLVKKLTLDSVELGNYRPVLNIPFLGKVLKSMKAKQLPGFLEENNYLDQRW